MPRQAMDIDTACPVAHGWPMSLGARIKALREAKGITQRGLGDLVHGAENTTVSRWELDKNLPTPENLQRLAEIFGVSEARLVYGDDVADVPGDEDEVARAIRYIFDGAWPQPDLESRIRERARLTGFSTASHRDMLASLVQRTKYEWEAEQRGAAPRTTEGKPVSVKPPREGAMSLPTKPKKGK